MKKSVASAVLFSLWGDNLTDYFIWNGVKSTEYGIHVSEHPAITIPAERQTFTTVPGRSGSLVTLEGEDVYDDMTLAATCWIDDPAKIPTIAKWLKGQGTVTFSNRTGGYYNARITNQIPFEQVLKGAPHRSFAVNFRCNPFFYSAENDAITVTESSTFIENKGMIFAEPVLQIILTGDAEMTVGGRAFELAGLTGTVTIATPKQECYMDYESKNSAMTGEYPIIPTEGTYVNWTGGVSSVVITPNWRML